MTDYKVLCAELTDELQGYASANPHHDSDELVDRARAALDEPESIADRIAAADAAIEASMERIRAIAAPVRVARAADPEGPSDEELIQLACNEEIGRIDLNGNIITRFYYPKDIGKNVITFARAVLARWGRLVDSEPVGQSRRCIYNPVQIAECGGPCEQIGPEACDCGALWVDQDTAQSEPVAPTDEELTLVYAYAVTAAVGNKRGPFKPEDAEAAQLAGLRAVLARWGTVSTPLPRTQNGL
jgi:hypothetical protein